MSEKAKLSGAAVVLMTVFIAEAAAVEKTFRYETEMRDAGKSSQMAEEGVISCYQLANSDQYSASDPQECIVAPAIAQAGCCMRRDSVESPWYEIADDFEQCELLNREEDGPDDDIFERDGLIRWNLRC